MTAVVGCWVAVLGIGGFLVWWLDVVAGTLLVIAGVVVLIIGARVSWRTKLRELREGRTGDPLCNFARAFDARQVDTWIIRAVWDSLQFYVARRGHPFPLLPGDRIVDDLGIDPKDLEDTAMAVAKRTGHSADEFETNPLFGTVESVGDLVLFVNHQPRVSRLRVG
jgi:hypothetical protein